MLRAACAAVVLTSCTAAAVAQPAGKPQVDPLVFAIPGSADTGAPEWVKPGVRLTFYASSSVRNSDPGKPRLEPDPNGNVIDDKGKRWRWVNPGGHGQAGSSGGIGWTTVDVIASEPGVLVLQQTDLLMPDGMNQPARETSGSVIVTHPAACAFFAHPKLLALMEPVHEGGHTVLRERYRHDSREIIALRVVSERLGFDSQLFDLERGTLLAGGFRSKQQQGHVADPMGNISQATAITQSTIRHVSTRQLDVPWATRPMQMPDWARNTKRLRFQGSSRMESATGNLPGAHVIVDIVTQQVGTNWSTYEVIYQEVRQDNVPIPPVRGTTASGPASLMGVWMDPGALRALKTGQVLDTDPTTGRQTMVEFAGRGQNGRPIVAIAAVTAVQRIVNVYDVEEGRLIQVRRIDAYPQVQSQMVLELVLTGVE
ncbi:MAG: hypothetical protein KIT24_12525 [Phycisphaeraceae bacterium]|nr:hypothetical protein [Phycisphaeraceae bacterium]